MAWLMHLLNVCCIGTGNVNITEENCEDLLTAADMLSVTGVVDACCLFMRERFQPENCIGTSLYFIFFILVRENHLFDMGFYTSTTILAVRKQLRFRGNCADVLDDGCNAIKNVGSVLTVNIMHILTMSFV